MSPIVDGRMYAELHGNLPESTSLNALVVEPLNTEYLFLLSKLHVLHSYIDEKFKNGTRVKVYAIKDTKKNILEQSDEVTLVESNNKNKDEITNLARSLDIDVIVDAKSLFTDKEITKLDSDFKIIRTISQLEDEVEIFCVGKNIAWNFKDAVWNMNWISRYFMREGLCRDVFAFMGEAQTNLNYSDKEVQRVRYLTNRIAQIDYSRDLMLSYVQRKRRSFRNKVKNQDYGFELNYHLSNYYFLITGGLDILARLLNDVLSLNLPQHLLELDKKDFKKELLKVHPDMKVIYQDTKQNEWIKWINERRNFVAHVAGVNHTKLVKEKKVKMTSQELEDLVDKETDWPLLKTMVPESVYESQREMVSNILRMNDYEDVAEDIMTVESGKSTKMFYPIRDIPYDYEEFQNLIRLALEELKKVKKD